MILKLMVFFLCGDNPHSVIELTTKTKQLLEIFVKSEKCI